MLYFVLKTIGKKSHFQTKCFDYFGQLCMIHLAIYRSETFFRTGYFFDTLQISNTHTKSLYRLF